MKLTRLQDRFLATKKRAPRTPKKGAIASAIVKRIQVAKDRIPSKDGSCLILCKYSDVPASDDGWVSDLRYLPISFDMTLLKIKDKPKPVPGWWDDTRWTGLRFRRGYKVTAWKRVIDY